MERDEIMKLQPGHELDALVAEHVFGEPRPAEPPQERIAFRGGYDHVLRPWIAVFQGDSETGEWVAQPYSTDLEWAWDVVERVTDPRHAGDPENWVGSGLPPGTLFMYLFEHGNVWAMSAKEAALEFCRWALVAVGA